MNYYLLSASALTGIAALIHSVRGELLLVRHLKHVKDLPVILNDENAARKTIRMVWHSMTVFSLALATVLGYAAFNGTRFITTPVWCIAVSMLVCALMAAFVTKGKHASWIAFLAVGILCVFGLTLET